MFNWEQKMGSGQFECIIEPTNNSLQNHQLMLKRRLLQGLLNKSKVLKLWELSKIRAVPQNLRVCMHTKWFSANYHDPMGTAEMLIRLFLMLLKQLMHS